LLKASKVEEKKVRENVVTLFKQDKYVIIKERFNVGVRPDVVAFKWVDEYQIEAIAVECKGGGKTIPAKPLIDFAATQAREYQIYFPYVYLATPPVPKSDEEKICKILETLRIGWISISNGKAEYKLNLQEQGLVSPRLVGAEYIIKVRQRLTAIWAYNEVLKEKKILGKDFEFNMNLMEPEVVHCFTKEVSPNFLLTNYLGDYFCGICLEQQKNVKEILQKIQPADFYKHLQKLSEPEKCIVEFTYVDTYKPREVSWPLMRKKLNQLSEKDIEWIKGFAKEKNWKTRLMLLRKVWGKNEILSKDEHTDALKKAINEVGSLKNYLEDLRRQALTAV
jgi:hypothetical protein